jgi:hypothetical protein
MLNGRIPDSDCAAEEGLIASMQPTASHTIAACFICRPSTAQSDNGPINRIANARIAAIARWIARSSSGNLQWTRLQ